MIFRRMYDPNAAIFLGELKCYVVDFSLRIEQTEESVLRCAQQERKRLYTSKARLNLN